MAFTFLRRLSLCRLIIVHSVCDIFRRYLNYRFIASDLFIARQLKIRFQLCEAAPDAASNIKYLAHTKMIFARDRRPPSVIYDSLSVRRLIARCGKLA
jgi:hypothetical protein